METVHAIPSVEEKVDNSTDSDKADLIVRRHLAWAVGGGLIPVPLVDIAAVTAIQIDMLKQLCKTYEVEFSEAAGKTWISTLVVNSATHIGASIFKAVPGIGTLGGGLMMGTLSAASTYGIGQVAIRHFEAGGTMADMKPEQYRAYFQEKVEEGKVYVRKQTGWQKAEQPQTTYTDPVKKMEDLQKLHKMGAVTDEEYETMKAKILGEF